MVLSKTELFSLTTENFSRNEQVLLNIVFSKNFEIYGRTGQNIFHVIRFM